MSVSIIEPGFFATQIIDPKALEKGMQRSWAQVSPEVKAKYGESYLPDTHQVCIDTSMSEWAGNVELSWRSFLIGERR